MTVPETREPVRIVPPLTTRQKRAAKERANHKCQECGAKDTKAYRGPFAVDHKIPRELGGSNEPSNLQYLCGPCHLVKSQKEDWPAIAKAKRIAKKHERHQQAMETGTFSPNAKERRLAAMAERREGRA